MDVFENLKVLTTICVVSAMIAQPVRAQEEHKQSGTKPASSVSSIQTSPEAVPPQPSLIDAMKRTVVFLETDCVEIAPNGVQTVKPYAGTAFLLGVADPRLGEGGFAYLVTNRHVAQPGSEDGHPCNAARYLLRIDLKEASPSGSYSSVTALAPSQLLWTYPTDQATDLAVTPIGVDTSKLDVIFMPSTLLMGTADMKSQHVQEGDAVLFSGLFIQLIGQMHSEPIVREGKIAMIPREPVPTTLRKTGDIFLVDCHVFGGNSGSPMFINLSGERNGSIIIGSNYRLLGVVSGYMKETSNFELQTVASYAGTMDANSGIATVVPAQKLLDLLEDPTLKKLRDEGAAAFQKQRASK